MEALPVEISKGQDYKNHDDLVRNQIGYALIKERHMNLLKTVEAQMTIQTITAKMHITLKRVTIGTSLMLANYKICISEIHLKIILI